MLCGQQHIVWNPFFGKWIDVTQVMGEQERWWRQRPVINRLFYWFVLTHARMTENPSIITFQPATQDRFDEMLAEVADPLMKTIWSDGGMDDVVDRRTAWMIPGGAAYVLTRWDASRGELRPWVGPGMVPLLDQQGQPVPHPETGQPIEAFAPHVPYDKDGNVLAQLTPDGKGYVATGQPHAEPEGGILFEALSPLQCRGEWGDRMWHRKRWHIMFAYTSLAEIEEKYGVQVEPESADMSASGMEIANITMGSGWYGAMGARPGSDGIVTNFKEGFAGVYTMWEAPSEQFPETEQSPGGRLCICTRTKCLWDGAREARFEYTSPLREYRFVNLPGRPGASTPQEAMNPLQRSYNRGWGQILQYRDLCTNPITIKDQTAGIRDKDINNRPGLIIEAIKRPGVSALEYLNPPRLGAEVFQTQQLLHREMQDFGHMEGAEGRPPTLDSSGELVKELRFNSDRFIAPTMRRTVVEDSRVAEDVFAILRETWDEERVITYAGEDQTLNSIIVFPELFKKGRVNVIPDVENALPEGRGEKQRKVMEMYQAGIFGVPGSPEAARAFLSMFRFPHLGRAQQPWGTDGATARRENGKLAGGAPAQMIPILPWYDSQVHLTVHEEFMKSPEFLEMDPAIQQQFALHWQAHIKVVQAMVQQQLAAQMASTAAMTAAQQPDQTGQPGAGAKAPAAAAA